MLTFITGPDTERAKERRGILAKFPLRETLKGDDLTLSSLLLKAEEQTLFGDTRAYVSEVEVTEDFARELLEVASALLSSPHMFVFETEGGAPLVKLLEKTKGEVVKVKAAPKEKKFDVFAVAGAYAAKDKKKLWLLLQEAGEQNIPAEALVGMLAWKARATLAQKGIGDKEAVRQSSELVRMYHDAHRGEGSLDLLLERFILNL